MIRNSNFGGEHRGKKRGGTDLIGLYIKGCCMGIADVIPGVSGGTMALILGIYEELIESLTRLHLRWVPPLGTWIKAPGRETWSHLRREFLTLPLRFLVPLTAGIGSAVAAGGIVLPGLFVHHPVPLRAFFFGLIIASVWIPLRRISRAPVKTFLPSAFIGFLFLLLAFLLTNPSFQVHRFQEWTRLESRGETLAELLQRAPSSGSALEVYRSSRNQRFRNELLRDRPGPAAEEANPKNTESVSTSVKDYLQSRSKPLERLQIPEGMEVYVPQLPYWYTVLVGIIAISAMILPGISGSYLLLMLGAYFFILSSLKGFLTALMDLRLAGTHLVYLSLFLVGVVVGLTLFSKLLHYLFQRWRALTLSALTGLMLGGLRGVWPFRSVVGDRLVNIWPASLTQPAKLAMVTFTAGIVLVGLLSYLEILRNRSAEGLE